jgi:hypothetical protein
MDHWNSWSPGVMRNAGRTPIGAVASTAD